MDALRQWALCLIIGSAAGTFVIAISPRGSMDKTVRAIVGIFVVAAICAPLAQLGSDGFFADAIGNFEYDDADEADEEMQKYMLLACRNAAEKQIKSTAADMKITVEEVCIDAEIDTESCIIIHDITIKTDAEGSAKATGFSEILGEKLGVPVTVIAE